MIRRFTALALLGAAACTPGPQLSAEEEALLDVKSTITTDLEALHAAALAIQEAAPAPDADGWNATDDAAAVNAMRDAWKDARIAYERVEGAIAVLFPNLDASTDERYDGFIEEAADDYLFDGEGVRGVHGIERILYADAVPQHVLDFESQLPGYTAPAFPSTEEEARDFKESLAQRLVDDTEQMMTDFEPLALDPASAYRGVIGSMEEQIEKIELAATGEDESRYAQHTLADMRANLDGGRALFESFERWLKEAGAEATYTDTLAAFDRVAAGYAALSGDALPAVPEGWNPEEPSAEHLETPYGKLYSLLDDETDAAAATSLVALMSAGADALGIPELAE